MMIKQPSVGTILNKGFNTFSKQFMTLFSAILILIIPFYILPATLALRSQFWQILFFIFAILISPIIQIIMYSIGKNNLELKKRTKGKEIWNLIKKRYFPTLWTLIMLFISFIAIIILTAIPFAIIGGLFAGLFTLIGVTSILSTIKLATEIIAAIGILITIIIASIYFLFSLYISIGENKQGINAIKKSIQLIKGHWWNAFGKMFVVQLVSTGLVFGVGIIIYLLQFISSQQTYVLLINSISMLAQQIVILPTGLAMIAWYLIVRKQ